MPAGRLAKSPGSRPEKQQQQRQLSVRIRANRKVESAAVNAARSFFEANDCVFQEIDLSNDYGKDAYIDLTREQTLTGTCIAAQIKGGLSYRRADGYAIPVGEHFDVWRDSSVPIAGIVHDPSDGLLRWCSITGYLDSLQGERPGSIPVLSSNVLSAETLYTEFRPHFEREGRRTAAGNCILDVFSESNDRRFVAISDCLAYGRSDPRVLISLRYLLGALDGVFLDRAIIVLTHATPHPDIFRTKDNWIPQDVRGALAKHFHWTTLEVARLLDAIDEDAWCRGGMGQHLYMLLWEDPAIESKIEDVIGLALDANNERVAWAALYLAVYWAGKRAANKLTALVARWPAIRSLSMFQELERAIADHGWVPLFE